jgi:hypothetical protein
MSDIDDNRSEALTDILEENLPPVEDIDISVKDEEDDKPEEEYSDEEEMTTELAFTGKADSLENILTHCMVLGLSNPKKFDTDEKKSGFLASLFRGPALDWLTTSLANDPSLLKDYSQFEQTLRSVFDTTDDNKKLVAQAKWDKLSQSGPASQFFMKAEPLLNTLNFNRDARINLARKKLKPKLQQSLIGVSFNGWSDFKSTVIDHDEAIFALQTSKKKRRTNPDK